MKLNFKYEIEIDRSLAQVTKLFSNRELLPKWQRGLLRSEKLPDHEMKPKYKLTFDLGRRKMIMTETIVRDELPDHYDVIYEMKGIHHTVHNSFFEVSDLKTKWISEVEFRFNGLKKLIAGLMKPGFERQTLLLMQSFKAFAERS